MLKHWSWSYIKNFGRIELLVLSSIVFVHLILLQKSRNPCFCRRILKSSGVQVAASIDGWIWFAYEFDGRRYDLWISTGPFAVAENHSLPLRIQVNYCQDTDMGSDDHNNYVKGVTTSTQGGDHSQILSNRWYFSENALNSGTPLILRSVHFELYVTRLFFPFNGSHVSCLADMVIAILG